jgi:hypothetical protein
MAPNHNSDESAPDTTKLTFDGNVAKLCEVPRLSPLADFPFATLRVTEHHPVDRARLVSVDWRQAGSE